MKGYLLKGDFLGFLDCSEFKILFLAIVITSAKDARGRGGGGDGEGPLFLGHVGLTSLRPYHLRAWNGANLPRPTDTVQSNKHT